jgi:hypothetical protein
MIVLLRKLQLMCSGKSARAASVARLRVVRLSLFVAVLTGQTLSAQDALLPNYGEARASKDGDLITLGDKAIEASWSANDGRLRAVKMTDRLAGKPIPVSDRLFALTIDGGGVISGSSMQVIGSPRVEKLAGKADASRLSDQLGGQQIEVELEDASKTLHAVWRAILRDGTNYIRQQVTLQAMSSDINVRTVRLVDVVVPGAHVFGAVRGSPAVAGDLFFGFEHPISESRVTGNRVICWIERELPLKAGQSVTYSSVVGVTPEGQLRRGFLSYIEHERAHPYRPFLHYNSWFDLRYSDKLNDPGGLDEAAALNAIRAYGTELVQKRGVKIDSFLFDDGWDDNATLWHFHSGFPNGFTPLREAAAKYGAQPGVWLSPWGGYGEAREKRMKYGREQGFETNQDGFALSGPKYFARFREISLEFIKKYGINQFKIDGTGNVNSAIPGSGFDSDFHAAISLIQEWRSVKPDIYVNLTSGTYPSPFWLLYADSTWRGGDDDNFAGVGSYRERWITYRDADTFQRVVQGGPLYPLNSLMIHGIIFGRYAEHLETDPGSDFENEVHSYFGSGTQLQEMYLTPSSLKNNDWDVLAETAKWSRQNASVLVDTHWVGGDPAMLEVYGWASWSPRKGILVLRNPSDKAQDFSLNVARAFEIPGAAARTFSAHSPWKKDSQQPSVILTAGQPHTFHLGPFQVLTLEAVPQ